MNLTTKPTAMEMSAGMIFAPFHTKPPLVGGSAAASAAATTAGAADAFVVMRSARRPRDMPMEVVEARRATLPAAAKVADLLRRCCCEGEADAEGRVGVTTTLSKSTS